MATMVEELHVHDEHDPRWRIVADVDEDGRITLDVLIDQDSVATLGFSPSDSTALVEFLGPKVKQVR